MLSYRCWLIFRLCLLSLFIVASVPPSMLGQWAEERSARALAPGRGSIDAAAQQQLAQAVARSQATAEAGSSTATVARVCWRTGAGRRQRALVVRGSPPAKHAVFIDDATGWLMTVVRSF
jgi:hypothetical protein